MTATADFLTTLQSQPWYSDVASEFANNAPNVPTELWEGELLAEDSSLNPAAQDYLNSGHYGLFQENAAFPTTVGLPEASVAQLENPQYNAYVAALAMEKALVSSGATTLPAQIQALEQAGWPGAASATDAAMREQDVNEILSQENSGGYSWTNPSWLNPFDPQAWAGANPAIKSAAGNATQGVTNAVNALSSNLLIGGLLAAGLTGAFILLATAASNGGASTPVPVPV